MTDLELKEAIYSKVISVLTDPSLWNGTAFTVYTDFEVEGVQESALIRPFVIIGTRNTNVLPRMHPWIGIDILVDGTELQLGTPLSLSARTSLNITGRQEGEASVIAGVLKKNMLRIVSGTQVIMATPLSGTSIWYEDVAPIPDSLRKEASLNQWLIESTLYLAL